MSKARLTMDENGELHSINGLPARILFFKNGTMAEASWYSHGKLHREDDLPAIVRYDENNFASSLQWYVQGSRCRVKDQPVSVLFHSNGIMKRVMWDSYIHLHRVTGPAMIDYDDTGNIIEEFYVINNAFLDKKDWEQHIEVQKYRREIKNNSKGTIVTDIAL